MQTQVQIRMQMQFEVIFASVWVRLKRFLPPFGSVSLHFSTAWALQVHMQVHMQVRMQVHMQSQMQLLFD